MELEDADFSLVAFLAPDPERGLGVLDRDPEALELGNGVAGLTVGVSGTGGWNKNPSSSSSSSCNKYMSGVDVQRQQ